MIENRAIEKEMKNSYLDYAMSVILARAIPDIKDGLKPVQRRILYSMYEMGVTFDKPYRKSARIVGEVMGKYHPHGDTAIYSALARMAQDFSLRYPLIQGQGNWGSIDGDPPGAMRYTEARLNKISNEVLADIEYETVDFVLTFDGTLKEPVYLPARIPNILLNGASGIAVGMATNMPPHNLAEVVNGLIYLIRKKDAPLEEILKHVLGPDFPTGGLILGKKGIIDAYRTGRGKIDLRARAEIEKNEIIFTEVPYEVNKSELLIKIAELSKDGIIDGISNIKDESNKEGIRIVVKVKNDFNPEITLNQIYEHTQAQVSYGIINLVLVNNVPRTMGLKEIMLEYLNHRELIVRRRTEFFLKKAREREHILEALLKALDEIDLTIKIIRGSKEVKDAREGLKKQFSLDDIQANAILETKLQKLTGMEISDLKKELKEIEANIEHYNDLLINEDKRWDLIVEELEEIREKYGDSRKTEITESYVETTEEELIPHEMDTIVLTEDNRISRIEADTFSSQKRGGKGVYTGSSESEIKQVITCDSHDRVFFFSDNGKVFQMKAYTIPKGERRSRAKLIPAIFDNMKGRIVFVMTEKVGEGKKYLLFVTEKGRVKKTEISQFVNIRSNGLIALKLRPGDLLKDVFVTDGNERIALLSTDGKLVLVKEEEFRSMGRTASGVTGIRFKGENKVASDATVTTKEMIVIAEKGLGKRVSVDDFSMRHRGAKGMKAIKITERTGRPIYVSSINEEDELLIITKNGKTIRTDVTHIPRKGRYAQGVKLIKLEKGDSVVSVTRIS
jgi:DNA gyrase subunit A